MIEPDAGAWGEGAVACGDSRLECGEKDAVEMAADLCLDGGYGADDVPGQLNGAVDRFTNSDGVMRIGLYPFIQGDVDILDGSLDMEEIALGTGCGLGYADGDGGRIGHERQEEGQAVGDDGVVIYECPHDYGEDCYGAGCQQE